MLREGGGMLLPRLLMGGAPPSIKGIRKSPDRPARLRAVTSLGRGRLEERWWWTTKKGAVGKQGPVSWPRPP
eukprot:gene19060-biopygen23458